MSLGAQGLSQNPVQWAWGTEHIHLAGLAPGLGEPYGYGVGTDSVAAVFHSVATVLHFPPPHNAPPQHSIIPK